MRKKDKIKRRSTPIFILVHSLSLEKLIQLSNPNPNYIFTMHIEFLQAILVPTIEKETKVSNSRVFCE